MATLHFTKTLDKGSRLGAIAGRTGGVLRRIDRHLFPEESVLNQVLRGLLPPDCPSVLDVGCGNKGVLLRRVPTLPFSVGVDVHPPQLEDGTARHSEYRALDIRSLADHFRAGEFDCVVALDVIEHLSRDEGIRLLEAMEAIARTRVVVYTPNGFLEQPPAPDNPHQEHVSGWTVDDFTERGYRVLGINGWKPLRGPYARIRWRPFALWERISLLSERSLMQRPRASFQLLAVRERDAWDDRPGPAHS